MKSPHKSRVNCGPSRRYVWLSQQQNFLFLSSEPRNSIYVPA
jgi:hypothetical protein